MFSTPLIDSSSGAATVSARTFGFAPGYWARTTTDGGTTSGYSEMGNWKTDTTPASRIKIDSTPAKMGRSIKNLETFMMATVLGCVPRYRIDRKSTRLNSSHVK